MLKAGRLGPEAERVVRIVFEDNATAGAHRADHLANDGDRIGHMFEQKARMSYVKRAPFCVRERQLLGRAGAKIDKDVFAGFCGQVASDRKLFTTSLDRHDGSRRTDLTGHIATELSEAAADVEHALAGHQMHLAERVGVEQLVHQSEAVLLVGGGAVEVLAFVVAHSASLVRFSRQLEQRSLCLTQRRGGAKTQRGQKEKGRRPFAIEEAVVKLRSMATDITQQLLDLNQKLLVSIVSGDWKTYESLCDESISCFEPEARGQLALGMAFHKYFFDLPASPQKPAKNVTMSQPHVRLMGDSGAVLSYVRLTQSIDANGEVHIGRVEETRVWQKIGGAWKHVHFHRSGNS
jgi:hypothetical protein